MGGEHDIGAVVNDACNDARFQTACALFKEV